MNAVTMVRDRTKEIFIILQVANRHHPHLKNVGRMKGMFLTNSCFLMCSFTRSKLDVCRTFLGTSKLYRPLHSVAGATSGGIRGCDRDLQEEVQVERVLPRRLLEGIPRRPKEVDVVATRLALHSRPPRRPHPARAHIRAPPAGQADPVPALGPVRWPNDVLLESRREQNESKEVPRLLRYPLRPSIGEPQAHHQCRPPHLLILLHVNIWISSEACLKSLPSAIGMIIIG